MILAVTCIQQKTRFFYSVGVLQLVIEVSKSGMRSSVI